MYFKSGQSPRTFRRWAIAAGVLFFSAAGLLTAPAFADDAPAATTCDDFGGSASYFIVDSSHIQIDEIDLGVSTDYANDDYSLAGQSWTHTGTVDENGTILATADTTDKTAILEYTGTATFNLRITKASDLVCTDTLVLGETDPADASSTTSSTAPTSTTAKAATTTSTTMKATTTTAKVTTTTAKATTTTVKSTPTTKAGATTTTTCKPGTTSSTGTSTTVKPTTTSTTMKPTTTTSTTSTTIPATTTTTSVTPTTIASVPTTILSTTTTTTPVDDETVDTTPIDDEPFPDDSAGIPASALDTPEVLGETITPSTDDTSVDSTDQSLAFTGSNTRKDLGLGALLLGIGACMVCVASYRREHNA